MSWFKEITGKAGALLDRMDQAAATSLQEAGIATPSKESSRERLETPGDFRTSGSSILAVPYEPTTFQSLSSSSQRGAAVAQVLVGSVSGAAQLTSTPHNRPKSPTTRGSAFGKAEHKDLDTDNSIFEFLNAPSVSSGAKKSKTAYTPSSSGPYTPTASSPYTPSSSRPSSARSEGSNQSNQQVFNSAPPAPSLGQSSSSADEGISQTAAVASAPDIEVEKEGLEVEGATEEVDGESESLKVLTEADPSFQEDHSSDHAAMTEREASLGAEVEAWKQKVSNLELENRLMKREVSALNEELSGVMQRLNQAADIKANSDSEIQTMREQVSRADQMVRQMRSQEEDLQASLAARDSQIEVLRNQLAAGDRALADANEKLAQAKKEQDRLVQDASWSSGAHNQALDSVKVQLTQALGQLDREREDHQADKLRFMERESALQSEQTQLSESRALLQKQVVAEQNRAGEVQRALQNAQREIKTLRKEHEDYKQRATSILQAKEKLIATLQQGESKVVGEARLEDSQLEKEHLQAQLASALQQLEIVRKDMQDLEEKSSVDMNGALEQVRVCEGVLSEEKKEHSNTREELARLNQELEMVREDLVRERTKHREDMEVKDAEIASLNLRLTSLTPGRAELEGRLHELTDSLIQKQTTLETLNSEKSTLNVQLQRLQSELAQAHRIKTAPSHTSIQINGPESSSEVPPMSAVIPSLEGTSQLRNVRKAVNTVDRISIRLGMFLKRYPKARLFTLLYMLLLHVWVMVVMLTYSPEMHDTRDHP